MVALPSTYKPSEVTTDSTGVPAGEYKVQVISSEIKQNKSQNGEYLEVVYLITAGDHQNNKIWDRFNFVNVNPQAVEIAMKQFKQLAEACGKPDCTDTDELNDCQLIVVIGPQKSNPQYTEVKSRVAGTASNAGTGTKKPAAAATTGKKVSWA